MRQHGQTAAGVDAVDQLLRGHIRRKRRLLLAAEPEDVEHPARAVASADVVFGAAENAQAAQFAACAVMPVIGNGDDVVARGPVNRGGLLGGFAAVRVGGMKMKIDFEALRAVQVCIHESLLRVI